MRFGECVGPALKGKPKVVWPHFVRSEFKVETVCREPVYPPRHVSFEIGPSPNALFPVGPAAAVSFRDVASTFLLPADAPCGRYLLLRLHGRVIT